ncbi:hypothetical protein WS89_19575 [Burkholderia sp. MSMB1072]|uniref:hypothetical protein n=1 Tax=unclassified Burkholderia TaxID=2613784 RepID=UPI00075D4CF2|nr:MULTISPECIES: hypothetical protein [unclassified Burkholderia]KVH58356.1 hypothetical protein WS89_19575 [Burkholderia sp. MSMB1072]KVT04575.1 hypothetical protein WT24_24100 [Burkholderia sp. MSMB1078WGS]KWO39689.1 hypothetical protein WT97_22180 [Burkholderia sp. MSMB1459WGS]
MKRSFLVVVMSMISFGVLDMALAQDRADYFEIRSGQGQMNPSPSMVFTADGHKVSYFSRGRDIDPMPPSSYFGIGKYTASLTGTYRQHVDLVKATLSSRAIPQIHAVNKGAVLVYSFDKGGHHYEGTYNYQFDDQFNDKLSVLYDLAHDLLAHGTPEINLHPTFSVRPAQEHLVIEVTFSNDGKQDVTVDGPDRWSADLARPDLQYVQIGGGSDNVEFDVRLVSKYLSDTSRRYRHEIVVKPGQPERVEFVVPYAALTFTDHSAMRRVDAGNYLFVGTVNLDILRPQEMDGRFFTPMDRLENVKLTGK